MACYQGDDFDFAVRVWLCKDRIVEDLTPRHIYDQLLQDDVITPSDRETVDHETTTVARANALVDCILQKDPGRIMLIRGAMNDVFPSLLQMVDDQTVTDENRSDYMLYVSRGQCPLTSHNELQMNRERLLDQLRCQLQSVYSNELRLMSPIPWESDVSMDANEAFSECCFSFVDELQRLSTFEIDIKSNYDWLSLTGPKSDSTQRILVEGEPGAGKTALCQKIALDWSTCISSSLCERFDIVLYFAPNYLDENISLSLMRNILPEDTNLSVTDVGCLLFDPAVQKRTLILVDGYDEHVVTQHIEKIWHRRCISHCTMLITSRPGFPPQHGKIIQARYTAQGLTKYGADKYIDNYIKNVPCESCLMRRSLSTFSSLVTNIRRNPLFLSLFLVVVDDNTNEGNLPTSKTQLLEEIVEVSIKRGLLKCVDVDEVYVQTCITELEKIAFESIIHQNDQKLPHWTDDYKPAKTLCQMGLLFSVKSKKKLRLTSTVRFSHRTLQEYFAAKYLASMPIEEFHKAVPKLSISQHEYIFVFMSGIVTKLPNNQSRMNIVYEKVAKDMALMAPGLKYKCDFQDRQLGWHNSTHLLLECIGESQQVPTGICNEKLRNAIPKCVCCSNHCKFCLRGISLLTQNGFDLDCVAVVSERSIGFLSDVKHLQKFVVRAFTEDNVCMTLHALLMNCQLVKHLYIYLLGPSSTSTETHILNDLRQLCKSKRDVIETLVWDFVCSMSKVKNRMPKYLPHILFAMMGDTLKHLVLHGCVFDDDLTAQFTSAIKNITSLTNVQISRSLMTTSISELTRILRSQKKLEHVNFEGLMDSDTQVIRNMRASDAAGTNLPEAIYGILETGHLKSISVDHQRVGSGIMFVKALKENFRLEVLCLHNVRFDFTSQTVAVLCKVLAMQSLKHICLRGLKLRSATLVRVVASMTNVERLDLSSNEGIHDVLKDIVASLSKLTELAQLFLEECRIEDDDLPLVQSLLQQGRIQTLSLVHNPIMKDPKYITQVESIFTTGHSLRTVMISLEYYSLFVGRTLASCWNSHPHIQCITIVKNKSGEDITQDMLELLRPGIKYKQISPYRYEACRTASRLHPYVRHQHFTSREATPRCFEMSHLQTLIYR